MSNPFGTFDQYWQAGWRGILPLPYGRKTWPPEGYTGYAGDLPSYADLTTWADGPAHNICLRCPDTVVGIDVDHYDGKTGGDTLAQLVARLGALPPTVMSTSRDDGISGIRVYRVPPGTVLPTKLPGIEFIQRHHRYVVCWPSIHPSGRVYRWIDERTGKVLTGPPRLADLPTLPQEWLAGLTVEAHNHDKADLTAAQAANLLTGLPDGDPCQHVLSYAGKAMGGGDRHDSYNEAVLAIVGTARRGCPGAKPVLARLKATFLAEVTAAGQTGRRSQGEAEAEWRRGVLGAVAIVAGEEQGHGCPDDLLWIEEADTDTEQDTEEPDEPSPFDRAVRRKLADLIIADAAKEAMAARKAARNPAPPVDAGLLGDILARTPDPPARVEGLLPALGRLLIVATRKTGKTTLMLNLARALITGEAFLGALPVRPINGNVALLNYEVSGAQVARWAADANIPGDRLLLINLRGRRNLLATESGRAELIALLRAHNVEILLIDPFGRAYSGASQNDAGEVGPWLVTLDALGTDAGCTEVVLATHAGWNGEHTRGSSALEDWPDSIIWLTRDAEGDQRYLRAEGRDVNIDEDRLDYDPVGRRLVLSGQGSRRQADDIRNLDRLVAELIKVITEQPGIGINAVARMWRERGIVFSKGEENKASHEAVSRGLVEIRKGRQGVHGHHLTTTPNYPQTTPTGVLTTPTTPVGGGGEWGWLGSDTAPTGGSDLTCLGCGLPMPYGDLVGDGRHAGCG